MSSTPATDALKRQFACVHKMLREAVNLCPADQWRQARHDFFVPARLAFHIVQATDFHLDDHPKDFNWNRGGINWEDSPPADLPDQPTLLAYLTAVEAKIHACLDRLADAGLWQADYAGFFPTAIDHLLYTLRHIQHHTGQINAELKQRGLKPARWR